MRLDIEWRRLIFLRDASRENLIYNMAVDRLRATAGVYIFGRRWGNQFEALYVGKARNIRGRVRGQLNNLRVMQHLRNAKTGRRFILTGNVITKPGQQLEKCLVLVERALIRYFLSEGHDLVNMQGTRLRRHELLFSGDYPRRFIPRLMFVEKGKGK
ncbi:MAG: hypothetical protein A3K83_03260 [Omnitrophica WOR_2 bacterium RBG_13_44_8b]|nr:MAG: hypothetical protein A3K83_03260 [Omnitrophica WOR_2 bacterium RBG_13_44_8b]